MIYQTPRMRVSRRVPGVPLDVLPSLNIWCSWIMLYRTKKVPLYVCTGTPILENPKFHVQNYVSHSYITFLWKFLTELIWTMPMSDTRVLSLTHTEYMNIMSRFITRKLSLDKLNIHRGFITLIWRAQQIIAFGFIFMAAQYFIPWVYMYTTLKW